MSVAELVPVRGRVYMADLGHGEKPFLVVSNNARNTKLGDCLGVRITTSPKPDIASIVPLIFLMKSVTFGLPRSPVMKMKRLQRCGRSRSTA